MSTPHQEAPRPVAEGGRPGSGTRPGTAGITGARAARRRGVRRAAPRWHRLLKLVAPLALLLVLLAATPASAHARLEGSDPAPNARLDTAPKAVTLTFNEPVEVSLGAIRVLDAAGNRIDRGRVEHPGGNQRLVEVQLQEGLTGGFAVGYRVTSADAHPIQGAFTYGVGGGTGDEAAPIADELLAGEGGSRVVGAVFAVDRWVLFGSLVLLFGAVAFVQRLWPAGRGVRGIRRLLWASWGVLAGATVASVGLQGAYAAGLPLTSALDPLLFADVFGTRYGLLALARLVLLLVAIPVLLSLGRPVRAGAVPAGSAPGTGGAAGQRSWLGGLGQDLTLLLGVGLLLTVALSGHASTGRLVPLAVVTDTIHLAAVSIWLGGLAVLVAGVLPRRDPVELAAVVPRFSSLAFTCVVLVAATGVIQGWRQVGTLDSLFSTTYGRLLLAKVAAVAVLVGLGALSRRAVRRRLLPATALVARPAGPGTERADATTPAADDLRRVVGAEVVIAVVVVALTALLVNAVPAYGGGSGVTFGTVAPDAPASAAEGAQVKVGESTVVVSIDPARTGDNVMHFSVLDASEQLVPVAGFSAELRLPSEGLGPIPIELTELGPGHYTASKVLIPIKGTWKLTAKVRQSEIDEDVGVADIRIR